MREKRRRQDTLAVARARAELRAAGPHQGGCLCHDELELWPPQAPRVVPQLQRDPKRVAELVDRKLDRAADAVLAAAAADSLAEPVELRRRLGCLAVVGSDDGPACGERRRLRGDEDPRGVQSLRKHLDVAVVREAQPRFQEAHGRATFLGAPPEIEGVGCRGVRFAPERDVGRGGPERTVGAC